MERNISNKKNDYLSLWLDNEFFAVWVGHVLEIMHKQEITPVPGSEEHILGIINFRGDIIPVVDFRKKFLMPPRNSTSKWVVLVLATTFEGHEIAVGAIVDKVSDVITIAEKDIEKAQEIGATYSINYTDGISKLEENFVTILNLERIFAIENSNSKKNNHH